MVIRLTVTFGTLLLLVGCDLTTAPILDAKGPVALAERDLLFTALGLMLMVVVPVFVMTFWFAWRYRASNTTADYAPEWDRSRRIEVVIWLVPTLIVLTLGAIVWTFTHRLDPYKPLASDAQPINVFAVAQDWKWLFIYPEQNIASVNQLAFPSGIPVNLSITSDTVMNSFMIPALGGQIYAMAGMETRLSLLADEPGRFTGRNVQYSGRGFSDQRFEAVALTEHDFKAWVEQVKRSQNVLNISGYAELARPSKAHPVTYYSSVEPGLFRRIIAKYAHRPTPAATNDSQNTTLDD